MNKLSRVLKYSGVIGISIFTIACSSSIPQSDSPELLPADSMMQGPGVFTGDNGAYSALESKKRKQTVSVKPSPTPTTLDNKDLKQTSDILEEKIRQSQRNTIELELLKRQVDQKLKTQ